ncbi:metallophosphoesterase [Dactylosporangium sp. NPDC000521]|uniref:metallophosphoesterase n=1 Tax=Dactylosporangium sp. NPDC000521 TaxID=3363975 RepID=UPI0036C0D9F8
MALLAHISDLHIDGTERGEDRARRVLEHLRGQPVDAVLLTGDIADHGAESEYETARRLLAGGPPVLACPGNHDDRGAFRKVLLDAPAAATPVNRLHRVGDLAVLLCDSTIPGRAEGRLDEQTLAWMRSTLDDLGDAPAVVAFHHPPVPLHHPLPDSMALTEPHALAAVLDRHPNVIGVLTGHAHTAAATTFAGRPVLCAPAVTWTLRLPWEGDDVADLEAPPALAYHVIDGDRIVTHYRVVP